MQRRLAALFVAALPLLWSCGAFGPAAMLQVALPDLPAAWRQAFPLLGCRILYLDAAGSLASLDMDSWGGQAVIECSKRANGPVLAWPVVPGHDDLLEHVPMQSEGLRPAGGVYPLHLDASTSPPTLVLSWEDGCCASVLSRLRLSGMDVSLLNARRLAACLRCLADPWTLDADAIAESLAGGGFSAYDIDASSCRDVRIAAGSGDWFLESPFSALYAADQEGKIDLVGVALGMHWLFSLSGRAARVYVGEQETAISEEW